MNAIVQKILFWCLNAAYNYIDKSNDGRISKEELRSQVFVPVMKLLHKINEKRNK